MISIRHPNVSRIIIGVDTHKDEHVAVAIDNLGVRIGQWSLATTDNGYAGLERWAGRMGDIFAFGVMMVAPVLLVFLVFQRWFVKGVATTGVKG